MPRNPPRSRVTARPFLKWVGGKGQLTAELLARTPDVYQTYHEPFVGGGALFFQARPQQAILTDSNVRLVRTWNAVKVDVDGVIERLGEHSAANDKDYFLEQRTRAIDAEGDADVAAWMIYLNKTGYNGMYRVNSKNGFNVPWGAYAKPTIVDEPNLRACSAALAQTEISAADFRAVLDRAEAGDMVYFDPPYVPLTQTSSFLGYTMNGFSMDDQRTLRDVAHTLKRRGVHVLISNSAAPAVRDLYAGDFDIAEVMARRSVNSKASGRGAIPELIMS